MNEEMEARLRECGTHLAEQMLKDGGSLDARRAARELVREADAAANMLRAMREREERLRAICHKFDKHMTMEFGNPPEDPAHRDHLDVVWVEMRAALREEG